MWTETLRPWAGATVLSLMTVESSMPDLSLYERGGMITVLAAILWYGARWASTQLERQRAEMMELLARKDNAFAALLDKKDAVIKEVTASHADAQRESTRLIVHEMSLNREAMTVMASSLEQLTSVIDNLPTPGAA